MADSSKFLFQIILIFLFIALKTYIYNFNGGFSPEKSPCKVEEVGKFKINII